MSNERIGLYEGMFLFPQSATANLQEAIDHFKSILDKSNATIINFKKWDERRLAYEIEGNKRGVYFLVYFNAPTTAVSDIERRCNQSEMLLRMMITKADHLPSEVIEANEGSEAVATEIQIRSKKSSEKTRAEGSTVSRKVDEVAPAAKESAPKVDEPIVDEAKEAPAAEEVTEA